jgi:acetyl-CoA carboxylase carboxyltransferase component
MDPMMDKLKALNKQKTEIVGGDSTQIKKQHEKGKLTARERIEKLLDTGSFQELDLLLQSAKDAFHPTAKQQPTDGVIVGYGEINGRSVFIWAQDATVFNASIGVVHIKKIINAMTEALRTKVPIIGIIDSIGERVEDSILYPHFYSLETFCKLQVMASGVIPQIVLVMGPCTGPLALSAQLADFVFMVKNTSHMHVAYPPKSIHGDELGPAWIHATKTGCCDIFAESEDDALNRCRQLLTYLPANNKQKPPFLDTGDDPERTEEDLYRILPTDPSKSYDMRRIISLLVDNGDFLELKQFWADNLITIFTRIGGYAVGLIANNPQSKGGSITLDAADKMARFVRFCDAFTIPLIWLADCPSFLPALEEETRGLIRHAAKMIFANAMATVCQIAVVTRKLYGLGGLAMNSLRLGGDLAIAWPTVSRGLMAPENAVSILYSKELTVMNTYDERKEQEQKRIQEIQNRLEVLQYESSQAIIDPRETRPVLVKALRLLANKSEVLPPRKHDNMRL